VWFLVLLLQCKVSLFYSEPKDWLGERLQNDLFCDEWDVKPPQLNQSFLLLTPEKQAANVSTDMNN